MPRSILSNQLSGIPVALIRSVALAILGSLALLSIACQQTDHPADGQQDPSPQSSPSVQPAQVTPTTFDAEGSPTPQGSDPTATPPTVSPVPAPTSSPIETEVAVPTQFGTALAETPTLAKQTNPTATTKPTFTPALAEPEIPTPPDRDLQELGRRLVAGYSEHTTILPLEPLTLGKQVDFWVSRDGGNILASGEVSHISDHVYWVFEHGYEPEPADIETVANNFETNVWPAVTSVFGLPITPGIDGDDRMVVYTSVLRTGVAGYFSAADSYPSKIRPHSNQREALYMSANRVGLTSTEYLSVIAHELQHATHFATDSSEDSWVNEGLSEVSAEIAGFARSAASAFVRAPATSLTAWAQDITVSAANYGAANLFFAFIAAHYGGNEMLSAIAQNQEDGIESIDSTLTERGFDVTADDVFADWLVANYLSTSEGPYSYKDQYVPPVRNIYKRAPDSLSGAVKSFGADYVVTSSGSGRMTIDFRGEPETSLLNAAPHSGDNCWWSNHGDSIDSTLTRIVDLRSISSATLKYWVNYEIEKFWDYGYAMVSTDDGETWDILDTERAINDNPNGNSYGAGLTGTSLGWVQDSADLSQYAGRQILLRFEYITDDAVFSKGACFDDFEIPELDWTDDTSSSGDWVMNGFVRVEETIPTQYLVQVIHEKDAGDPVIYKIPIGTDAVGSLTVEGVGDDDLIVVVISAVTRQSTLPTDYTLSIYP